MRSTFIICALLAVSRPGLAESPTWALEGASIRPVIETPAQCADDIESSSNTISESIFGNENSCLSQKGIPGAKLSPAEVQGYESALKFRKRATPLTERYDLKSALLNDFFQDMASRSHQQLSCRAGTLQSYLQNPLMKQQLNEKALAAYNAVRDRLESLVVMSQDAQEKLNEARNMICEPREFYCETLRAKAAEHLGGIEQAIAAEVVKIPYGYEPDVTEAILTMAAQFRFDAALYENALAQAQRKYSELDKYYTNQDTPTASGQYTHYCVTSEFKQFVASTGTSDKLLRAYPSSIMSNKAKNILQCKINSKYKTAPSRLNTTVGAVVLVSGGVAAALTAIPSGGTSIGLYATAVNMGLSAVMFVQQIQKTYQACVGDTFVISADNTCKPEAEFQRETSEVTMLSCLKNAGLAVYSLPIPPNVLSLVKAKQVQ
ncbi:MAG: hypothetical protein ACXWQQ_05160 [Pseudobdellovibrio sp.]